MNLNKDLSLLVYKDGISNQAVKSYLALNKISYDTIPKAKDYDFIIKPPSMPFDDITASGKIICDIELAYILNPFFSFAVTGTSGKTTCVLLINHLLKDNYKISMCGNIGIPIFDIFDDERKIYLLEMSSFELDSIISYKPRIAVLLNIKEAHLDHHKNMENYIKAKAKITKNQGENDFLIYNIDDLNVTEAVKSSKAIKISISLKNENADGYIKNNIFYTKYGNVSLENNFSDLEGDLYDTMAAVMLGLLCDLKPEMIKDKLKSFKKPHYRMEEIYPGIYNDSKSTNIYSTLSQIKKMRNISLICGGYDRYNSLEDLRELKGHTKMIYLYGQNKNRVASFLLNNQIRHAVYNSLEEALQEALKDYETILFSPMAPSYDQFKSFEERGSYFNDLIKKYLPR